MKEQLNEAAIVWSEGLSIAWSEGKRFLLLAERGPNSAQLLGTRKEALMIGEENFEYQEIPYIIFEVRSLVGAVHRFIHPAHAGQTAESAHKLVNQLLDG